MEKQRQMLCWFAILHPYITHVTGNFVYCICRLSYYLFLKYSWSISEQFQKSSIIDSGSWFAVSIHTWLDAQQQNLCFAAGESKPRCCKHRGKMRLRLHPLWKSLTLFAPFLCSSLRSLLDPPCMARHEPNKTMRSSGAGKCKKKSEKNKEKKQLILGDNKIIKRI